MACDGVMELMMNVAGTRLLVTDTLTRPQRPVILLKGATYGVHTHGPCTVQSNLARELPI